MDTPRVEAVIDKVIAEHPGLGDAARARYFEEVHQHLAPLARDLERELRVETNNVGDLTATVDDLAAIVRRLAHSLCEVAPDNELPKKALDYLKRSGIPTFVLREIERTDLPAEGNS